MASGVNNIAVLMTPRIFDELHPSQRNALRISVYGDNAGMILQFVVTKMCTSTSYFTCDWFIAATS